MVRGRNCRRHLGLVGGGSDEGNSDCERRHGRVTATAAAVVVVVVTSCYYRCVRSAVYGRCDFKSRMLWPRAFRTYIPMCYFKLCDIGSIVFTVFTVLYGIIEDPTHFYAEDTFEATVGFAFNFIKYYSHRVRFYFCNLLGRDVLTVFPLVGL